MVCPDLHDLAVSKCVVARDKDADFIRELLNHALITAPTLHERLAMLEAVKFPLAQIDAWIDRRVAESVPIP